MKLLKIQSKSSKSQWLLLLFLFTHKLANSQYNLVPNYSFENYTICPNLGDYSPLPPPWYRPTKAGIYQSGVYANACSNYCAGVPYNCLGDTSYQLAHSGQAYGLFASYSTYYLDERGYVQTPLSDSLKFGKRYYVQFYISLANTAKYASNNLSLLFTKQKLYADTSQGSEIIIPANPQITNYGNPIITDTLNWVKVSGLYTAQGGEKFITIGNFKHDNQTNIKVVNSSGVLCSCAEYYLDDVSVIPLDSMPLKADAGKDTTITIGDSVFIGSYTNGIDSLKWQIQNTGIKIDSTRPGFWVKPLVNTCYVLTQTVNGYTSSDTVCITVGLVPLKFISYAVSLRGTKQSVENTWQTANEINVSHFNIQRSTNGKDFITIGKVAAQNNNINHYEFIDVKLPTTTDQLTIYYQLQSIDKDGKKQYSETRNIKLEISNGVSIFPNPAKDFITISSKEGIKEVKITNHLGQVIHYKKNINHTSYIVNLTSVAAGVYFVNVLNYTTGKLEVKKVILE